MADNKIYKKGGKFFEQDPQYDTQMKAEGYEDATPEETAVYLADERPSKPYDPSTQADEQDAALANEIEIAERAQGREVSKEDALLRAQNIRSIMGERPVYPEIDETLPSQEGDTGLTILDGVLGGFALGAPKFLVRNIVDAMDARSPTEPPSTFSTTEMERRARANPSLLFGVEMGTGLLQGGVGALKTAAPKAFAKLGLAGRFIERTDIAGRAAGAVGRGIGKMTLGKGAETLAKGQALAEISAIGAKEAAAAELTAAEKAVADAVRGLETLGTAAQRKGFEEIVENRTTAILEEKLAEQYAAQGWKGPVVRIAANAAANAIVGAGAGAVTAAQQKQAERTLQSLSLSGQQQESFFEDYGAAVLRGGAEGAAIGAGLSLGIPIASAGLGLGLSGVRRTSRAAAEKALPFLGTLFTRGEAAPIRYGVKAADALADISIAKENKALVKALQQQYDYAEGYLEHIKGMKAQLGDTSDLGNDLGSVMDGVRKKFMRRNKDGKLVYDEEKVQKALANGKLEGFIDSAGNKQIDFVLPKEIEALQETIASWEQTLLALEHDTGGRTPLMAMEGTPPIDTQSVPYGVLPPTLIPDRGVQAAPLGMKGAGVRKGLSFPTGRGVGGAEEIRLATIGNRYEAIARLGKEKTKEFGGELYDLSKELGLGTLLGQQIGFSIPEALGGAAAASFGVKALVNPNAAVGQFRVFQKAVGLSQQANKNFAAWVVSPTRGRATAGEALRKTTNEAYKLYTGEDRESTQLNEPFSLKAAKQLYQMDRELLGRIAGPDAAGNIDAVFGNDYRRLETAYPSAGNGVAQITPKQVAFLNSKLPKLNGREPSNQELYNYGIYSRYVRDPDAIYDDIVERNYVPSQALEVLQKVYPSRLYQIQGQLIDAMAAMKERGEVLDSKQQRIADSILGKGNTAGLTPAQIKALQQQIQLPVGAAKEFSSRRPELEKQGLSPRK